MGDDADRHTEDENVGGGESRAGPLPDAVVEMVAEWLRVIAEPTRIRLMEILDGGGASVGGLAAQLGTSRQSVHQHLGVLRQVGIVGRRRIGNRLHYELTDWSGWWLVRQAAESVEAPAGAPGVSSAQLRA